MADQQTIEGPAVFEIHCYGGKDLPSQYQNVVRSRWVRTYRNCNDMMKLVFPPAYYSAYSVYVKQILARPLVEVRLAVLQEDPDVVLGFSITEAENVLHYVEVKRDLRRNGIATALVPNEIKWFSHITKTGLKIWSRKYPEAHFSPFI